MCNLCDSMQKVMQVLSDNKKYHCVTSWPKHTIETKKNTFNELYPKLIAVCSKNVSIYNEYISDDNVVHLVLYRTKAKDETKCR